MKKYFLIISCFLVSNLLCMAQEFVKSIDTVLIIDHMQHAIVHQDSTISQLMKDKRVGKVRGVQITDGYRVQIYASNNQLVAKKEATELQMQIENTIDMPVYIVSEPPFWKVRVGDFLTREEANACKNSLLELFPDLVGSTYIVPDKIHLIQ